jgi:hypothetical protein
MKRTKKYVVKLLGTCAVSALVPIEAPASTSSVEVGVVVISASAKPGPY